jgi:hypothetical protein
VTVKELREGNGPLPNSTIFTSLLVDEQRKRRGTEAEEQQAVSEKLLWVEGPVCSLQLIAPAVQCGFFQRRKEPDR